MENLFTAYTSYDVLRIAALIVISPIIGSFLGLVAMRWGSGETIVHGRSRCDSCGHTLSASSLIPIISFIKSRGRCAYCGAKIPPLHLAVELGAVAVALASAFMVPLHLMWITAALGWVLLLLAAIDFRTYLLPDALTLPLLLAGIALGFWRGDGAWPMHVTGAVLGWGGAFLLAFSYRMWRGRDGLGGGDVKLFSAAGAWMGPLALPSVALYSALTGLLAVLVMAMRGEKISNTTMLPFGPFLALGIFATWICGPLSLL